MKEITIQSNELRQLLFWAMVGFTDSNGGTYENEVPKTIAKYVRLIKMNKDQFPPMGMQSHAELTGKTLELLNKELKEN